MKIVLAALALLFVIDAAAPAFADKTCTSTCSGSSTSGGRTCTRTCY